MKDLRVDALDLSQSDQILDLLIQLNPDSDRKKLNLLLVEVFALDYYHCLGLFKGPKLVGLSGLWVLIKFYSGKQIEIDNFVIDHAYRSLGYGKILLDHIESYAREINCKNIELNAYIINERGHKFYEAAGFKKLGFHFVKKI